MGSQIDAHQLASKKFQLPNILVVLLAMTSWGPPVASAWPFHDDEHEPQSFKEVVHRLVRASRENLRPLKTFRVDNYPSGDYWYEVEVKLPGAKRCRIYEHPQMIYRCEWNKPPNTPMNAVYASAVKSFEEALGSTDWSVRKSSNGASMTRFEPMNPRRNPVFEVRLGGQRSDPTVEVLLYPVDRWGP